MKMIDSKFKLANASLLAALAVAMAGCNDDSSSSNNSGVTPPVQEYVADKGFHIDPTVGLFSGAEGETPNFVVPENALTPIVTSDTAVKSESTRQVVQFTTVAEAGLVAGFAINDLALDSMSDTATFEFDLRTLGVVNGVMAANAVAWLVELVGINAAGDPLSQTLTLPKAATGEWQHYVITQQDLLDAGVTIATLQSLKIYPNAAHTVYNLDNVAIYPEYKDSEGPVLVLNGEAEMTQLNYPDVVDRFEDPGYQVTDNQDDPSAIVVKEHYGSNGEVNADQNGTYQITYSAVDTAGNYGKPVTRTVIIEAAPSEVEDTTPPVVTLKGAATVRVPLDGTYQELGATAMDAVDGVISDIVIDSSQVNVNELGQYKVFYRASDKAGNVGNAERTVVVYQPSTSENLITNGDFSAELGDSWELQEGAGSTNIVDGQLVISDYAPGASWQPRLVQAGVEMEVGQTYLVEFDAKADQARNIVLQVGELLTTEPWYLPIMEDTTVSLTTEMSAHSVQFTATEHAANPGHLIFAVGGGAATPITLDNISLKAVTEEMIAPVLTLTGGTVRLAQGEEFVEPGFSAIDNIDGDLSGSVVVEGDDFDTSVVGAYTITYTVQDSDGNISTAQRIVQVMSAGDVDNLVTNGDFSAGMEGWLQFGGINPEIVDGAVKFTTGVLKQERFAEGQVQGGDVYDVSFRFKGTFSPGGVFKVGLHSEMAEGLPAMSVWNEYWEIGSDWQTVEVPWTIAEGAESISIELLIAGPEGQEVFLDDVTIKPAE